MKKHEKDGLESEAILLGIKPMVDEFHTQKRVRSKKYPLEVRHAIVEALNGGMSVSKVSKLLGIKPGTISTWKKFLPNKKSSSRPRLNSVRPNLKELQIIPEDQGVCDTGPLGEMVEVQLPNQVILKIPSHMVGLDLLKGLMALEASCS